MTAEFYYAERGELVGDYITAAEAQALFDGHKDSDGFDGGMEDGFAFWRRIQVTGLAEPVTLNGVAVRVRPVPDGDVPAHVRAALDRQAEAA